MIKPQRQIVRQHNPEIGLRGDCFRTCVAMLLGRHLSDVPHVGASHPDDMVTAMRDWLAPQGLSLLAVTVDGVATFDACLVISELGNPGIPLILSGQSPRGPRGHCVVVLDGKVVCDPITGEAAGAECLDGPQRLDGAEGAFWFLEAIVKLPEEWKA